MYNTDLEQLEQAILSLDSGALLDLVKLAYETARGCHQGQTRDEGVQYFVHPYRVALYLVEKLKVTDPEIVAAALLHDVLEDCPGVCFSWLEEKFGTRVAVLVEVLSKPPLSRRLTRQRRDENYYQRIGGARDDVVMIKLADRLDNLRSLHLSPRKNKMSRYIRATRQHLIPLGRKRFPIIADDLERAIECLMNLDPQGNPPGGYDEGCFLY